MISSWEQTISTPRFTPEFKEQADRQIVERGYPVYEVSERLGVSAHSLYKWVMAVRPDKSQEQAAELIAAKSEFLKLRSQLRRVEEERDILKKAARYLCWGARVKYRFINDHRHEHGVWIHPCKTGQSVLVN
jgi:transposase-like protein